MNGIHLVSLLVAHRSGITRRVEKKTRTVSGITVEKTTAAVRTSGRFSDFCPSNSIRKVRAAMTGALEITEIDEASRETVLASFVCHNLCRKPPPRFTLRPYPIPQWAGFQPGSGIELSPIMLRACV